MIPEITLEAMEKWLASKNPDDFAGYPANPGSCLVAEFLKSKGALLPSVGCDDLFYYTPTVASSNLIHVRLNDSTKRFVQATDHFSKGRIFTYEALTIIRKIAADIKQEGDGEEYEFGEEYELE